MNDSGDEEISDDGNNPVIDDVSMEIEYDMYQGDHPFRDRKVQAQVFSAICCADENLEKIFEDNRIKLDMFFSLDCYSMACTCDMLEEFVTNQNPAVIEEEKSQIESGTCPLIGMETRQRMRRLGCSVIHTAVRFNNTAILNKYIQEGGDVNLRTLHCSQTLLHFAVRAASTDCLQILLAQEGIDIHAVDFTENTALLYATSQEQIEYMKLLINAGSNINHADCTGESAFMNTVRNNFAVGAQLLVDAGVDVNATEGTDPPLLEALDLYDHDIIKIIINSGRCDLDKVTYRYGRQNATALQRMIYNGEEEIVELLLKAGADPNKKISGNDSDTVPLIIATMSNQKEMVRKLIKYGADVNIVDRNMYSAIHLAAWDGQTDIVRILLAEQASHDQKTIDLNTPVALACHGDHGEVVDILLALGCNINNRDKDADTALHYAAFNGNLKTVKTLLAQGALPDPRNTYDATPLWNAVCQQHVSVVHFLLTKNVSLEVSSCGIDQHSNQGDVVLMYNTPRSLLYVASSLARHDIITLLITAGVSTKTETWIKNGTFPEIAGLPIFSNTLSLKQLSRIAARRCLGMHLENDVKELMIPLSLRSYLLFCEI